MARGVGLVTQTPVISARIRARQEAVVVAGSKGSIEALIDSTAWALNDTTTRVTLELLASYNGGATYALVCAATWTSGNVRASINLTSLAGKSPSIGPQLGWEPDPREPTPTHFKVAIFSTANLQCAVKVRVP